VLPSKNQFQDHFRWLRKAAKAQGLEVLIELDSMAAYVRQGRRHWVLYPQFIAEVDGRTRYIPTFADNATHLAGWMPRPSPGWPASRDKLVFKRAAAQAGLPVPDFSLDADTPMRDVVVKRSNGSFGEHVHGPFKSSQDHRLNAAEGEYFERFIDGELLKIWYWQGEAIGLECDRMPTVLGDGRSTLRQLIERRASAARRPPEERLQHILERSAQVLKYEGTGLDAIPAQGHRQRVEFRYGSDLMGTRDRHVVDLRISDDPSWAPVRSFGPRLLSLIPPPLRTHALFSVDAVRAADGTCWLLEMNANPTVHPLAYPIMLESLAATVTPAPATAAPTPTPVTI
jgi:hypothetical protein